MFSVTTESVEVNPKNNWFTKYLEPVALLGSEIIGSLLISCLNGKISEGNLWGEK